MVDLKKDDIAVKVSHVKKDFYLPHEKRSKSFKSAIVNYFKKKDKGIDTQHALKDVSFEIKKGEFFGIVGRNGSGKSTLLKIIAQIYQPTKGKVEHFGKLVPFIELGVGFNPELSGRENVYLNGALLGFTQEEITEKYDGIVEFAELDGFMDQKLKNYSSGMQVRLAFSVAIQADADILVLDEVLAVGDADFQKKCYDYFKSLKRTGTTVIFVTHNMSAANEYCDRGILIENGNIVSQGNIYDVSSEYLKLFNTKKGFNENNNRWGNNEVIFGKVEHLVNEKNLDLSLEIENTTNKKLKNVDLMIDIYMNMKLVTGYSYKLHTNEEGIQLSPKEKKIISLKFPNYLSKDTFDISLTLKEGNTILEAWENVIRLTNDFGTDRKYKSRLYPIDINIDEIV